MQKIVILSPAHPLRGGIASSSQRLARALQEAGYEVTIFSFKLQYPSLLFPGKTQYTDDPAPKDLSIDTQINSINPLNWLRVGLRLRKMRPDLVIARYWIPFMGPCMGTILRLARMNGHTKTISLADNIIPHEKRIGDRQFTQYFTGGVDGFLVMSKAVGADVRQFSKSKPIECSPHPIYDNYGAPLERSEALQHLGLDPSYQYLLFFGFIREYKGLDLLLNAMADERLREKKLKLIVAGEYYGNREYYEQIIAEQKIEDQLIMRTEFIAHEAVRYYFSGADLIVQPYKSATQSGISQLAYYFGKPMVVTHVGGLPEIVLHEQTGYVVPVDAPAIADAIVDYFEAGRSARMVQAVAERKHLFSWENMVQAILKLAQRTKKTNKK
ncbi:MAG: glycosyltransferase [Bacteroidota bacterium]